MAIYQVLHWVKELQEAYPYSNCNISTLCEVFCHLTSLKIKPMLDCSDLILHLTGSLEKHPQHPECFLALLLYSNTLKSVNWLKVIISLLYISQHTH